MKKILNLILKNSRIINIFLYTLPISLQLTILALGASGNLSYIIYISLFSLSALIQVLVLTLNFVLRSADILLLRNKQSIKGIKSNEKESLVALVIYIVLVILVFMFIQS